MSGGECLTSSALFALLAVHKLALLARHNFGIIGDFLSTAQKHNAHFWSIIALYLSGVVQLNIHELAWRM